MSLNVPLTPEAFQIDFAVITQNITEINKQHMLNHIIDLDTIPISETIFKTIFYKFSCFSIANNIYLNSDLIKYISFSPLYRTVLGDKFCLIDEIYKNIENDLSIGRNMFSTCTNIALNKQINAIKTLSDLIPTSTVSCSLSWNDIVNTVGCQFCDMNPIQPSPEVILTLSVIFISPTPGVYPTIVKFNYKTNVTILV